MNKEIKEIIENSIETHNSIINLVEHIDTAAKIIITSLKNGNKILICGNGGSASQAQHFAAELVGRFEAERKALPCISLTTDTSNLTSGEVVAELPMTMA